MQNDDSKSNSLLRTNWRLPFGSGRGAGVVRTGLVFASLPVSGADRAAQKMVGSSGEGVGRPISYEHWRAAPGPTFAHQRLAAKSRFARGALLLRPCDF